MLCHPIVRLLISANFDKNSKTRLYNSSAKSFGILAVDINGRILVCMLSLLRIRKNLA